MIKCNNCNAEIPEGTKFCPACGSAVPASEPVAQEVEPVAQEAEPVVQEVEPVAGAVEIGATPVESIPTPVKKKKNKKKIIAIVVAVLAVLGILAAILVPIIARAIMGEATYYLYREGKYFENKYKASDISLEGLENVELRMDLDIGEDLDMYALIDVDDSGNALIKLMSDDESIAEVGVCETYMTISIPMLSDEVYYKDLEESSDKNDDADLTKSFETAYKEVKFTDYIDVDKDGKTVTFTTDDERLAEYLDALIEELNKDDDFSDYIDAIPDIGYGVKDYFTGDSKFSDEINEDYNYEYKYVVVYEGKSGIASREFYYDDDLVFSLYENDDGDLVFESEEDDLTITLSDYENVKTINGCVLPSFTLKIKEYDEKYTLRFDAQEDEYTMSFKYDDETYKIKFSKEDDIKKVKLEDKDDCTLLEEDTLMNLYYSYLFGSMLDYDYDFDYSDYDFDYSDYDFDYSDYDFDYSDYDFDYEYDF